MLFVKILQNLQLNYSPARNNSTMETKQKIFVTIGTAAVVAAAIFGGAALFNGSNSTASTGTVSSGAVATTSDSSSSSNTTSTSGTDTSSSGSTSSSTTASGSYKDGTYTKTVSYYVPHGATNTIKVTLVVSGGVITSATTDKTYYDNESGMYINSFESSVSSDASGQSLASYSPSRIGGASLTTEAFAEAISGIRTDAAA